MSPWLRTLPPGVFAALLLAAPLPAPQPVGTIAGHVRDPSGAPIQHAQVVVVGTDLWTLSDAQGVFAIANVPVGRHDIRASFIGYKRMEMRGVEVFADSVTRVELRLEPAAVEIEELTVVAADGVAMPRAEVTTRQRIDGMFTGKLSEGALRGGGFVGQGLAPVPPGRTIGPVPGNTENYAAWAEQRFLEALAEPLATFSIDVDAASYTNVRRHLEAGTLPPPDAVRIEEFLNYFRYDYPAPTAGEAPVRFATAVAPAPWAPGHQVVRIALKARELPREALPPANLVFLLDVSGSMQDANKLPLVREAFRLLVPELRPQDQVAIVVYAGAAGLVLPPTAATAEGKRTILEALARLEAGGSTAGGEGLRLAYDVAQSHFIRGGSNRVILATDGDFNVGESSDAAMIRLVEARRASGVFLTVLGFGMGNLKDGRLEQMADKGNGHYAYVDGLAEARRVFVRELAGTLVTLARDVKLQVEWNPARVRAYRLIGYDNRRLANADFDDDTKDAGELGVGHAVTALYEIVPADAPRETASGRYVQVSLTDAARRGDELATVRLRYKTPTGGRSRLHSRPIPAVPATSPDADFRFALAVAEAALVLRQSEHRGSASLAHAAAAARASLGEDQDGERAAFAALMERAATFTVATEDRGARD